MSSSQVFLHSLRPRVWALRSDSILPLYELLFDSFGAWTILFAEEVVERVLLILLLCTLQHSFPSAFHLFIECISHRKGNEFYLWLESDSDPFLTPLHWMNWTDRLLRRVRFGYARLDAEVQ